MADSLAYQAEKQLKDLGDKVPAGERSTVKGLVSDLRQAINQENYDRMKSLSNDLQQALMQVGSAVYAQAGSTTGDGGTPRGGSSNDVIDADFVDSK
jgi:molecular chaperone DnaK